ncbi:MAG: hypothetical protein M3Q71_12000 [Chloroflexota bacterium]|nr:hypothetical protein [Chloroflexota bacterium]MDP9471371.1 hypothetical protein [Chloroflexota bacterium]
MTTTGRNAALSRRRALVLLGTGTAGVLLTGRPGRVDTPSGGANPTPA